MFVTHPCLLQARLSIMLPGYRVQAHQRCCGDQSGYSSSCFAAAGIVETNGLAQFSASKV